MTLGEYMVSNGHPVRVAHFGMSNCMGGAESFILGLAENIDKTRFKIEIITPFRDYVERERLADAIGEAAVHIVAPLDKPLEYWKTVCEVLTVNHYDIVHVHRNSAANILPIAAASYVSESSAIVVHAHNSSSGAGGIGNLLHRANRHFLNAKADCRIACSSIAGRYLFGSKNYTIVPNGIDVNRFRFNEDSRMRLRRSFQVVPDDILIGNVARAVPEKNQRYLIEMIAATAAKGMPCKLMIVGDGKCLPDLKAFARERGIKDRVIFTGARPDVHDLLQAIDIFALPSLFEGLPMVLVEAQAAGLTCLVSDAVSKESAFTDLVTFLPLNDPSSWIEGIMSFKRPNNRAEYAEEVKASGFDVTTLARTVEGVYSGVCNLHS